MCHLAHSRRPRACLARERRMHEMSTTELEPLLSEADGYDSEGYDSNGANRSGWDRDGTPVSIAAADIDLRGTWEAFDPRGGGSRESQFLDYLRSITREPDE